MSLLSVIDPLQSEVFFDATTIAIKMHHPELSTDVFDILKSTIKDPSVIIEVESTNRIYVRMNKNMEIRGVNVVLTENFWSVESLDFEMKQETLLDMIQGNEVIYKK